jgi:hypothetical protein
MRETELRRRRNNASAKSEAGNECAKATKLPLVMGCPICSSFAMVVVEVRMVSVLVADVVSEPMVTYDGANEQLTEAGSEPQ